MKLDDVVVNELLITEAASQSGVDHPASNRVSELLSPDLRSQSLKLMQVMPPYGIAGPTLFCWQNIVSESVSAAANAKWYGKAKG